MSTRIFCAWTFLVFFSAFALGGCRLKQYDPVTADQISRTISYETATYAYVVQALEDGVWAADERLGLGVRHESEIARLEAWLRAEEAKENK